MAKIKPLCPVLIDSSPAEAQNHYASMVWFSASKEKERFYLLPGMGGRNYRRKQRLILGWSIVAGLLVSAVFAAVLYWMGSR